MSSQFSSLGEGRVLPDAQLVLSVSVRRDQFLASGGPDDGRYLRESINRVEASTSVGVPETDVSVSRSSSSSEEILLPWAPSESLDSSSVIGERELGRGLVDVPDVDNVVVSTRSKLKTIVRPLESTDFLSVVFQRSELGSSDSNIVINDGRVLGSSAQHVVVPGEGSDASSMTT